jgi:CheY-like chemotaxis protein
MTAHALKGFEDRCLEAGMDDYLTKPIRPELLQRVFQNVILSRRTKSIEQPQLARPVDSRPASDGIEAPSSPVP